MISITKSILNQVERSTNEYQETKKLVDFLKTSESTFFDWVTKLSYNTTHNLITQYGLPPSNAETVTQLLTKMAVAGYYAHFLATDFMWRDTHKLDEELEVNVDAVYSAWINGSLPESFYPKRPKKNSDAYKARQNFLLRQEAEKEMDEAILDQRRKFDTLDESEVDIVEAAKIADIPFLSDIGRVVIEKGSDLE